MSTVQDLATESSIQPVLSASGRGRYIERFLKLLCSVRLGVSLLVLLVAACLIGMLVMQQNVDGFDRYYLQITPAQRLIYDKLGLFNIYRSWYFNALLCALSLNIILASIDRFPKTWLFVSKPNLTVPLRWLSDQRQTAVFKMSGPSNELTEAIAGSMKRMGWKSTRMGEKGGVTYIFAQSGTWNRFGAYAVHVGLLTIFVGGFLTSQFSATGQLPLSPGQTTNLMFETVIALDRTTQVRKRLPFDIACLDTQQRLIRNDGALTAQNTIDWITQFSITDEYGTHAASVQMNRPYDYRGYRFFQASFTPVGRARRISVIASPATGGESQTLTILRGGTATLPDGTSIEFSEFRGNFSVGKEDPKEDTSTYPNPGAILSVTRPGEEPETAYAFGETMAGMPIANNPVAGYSFRLADFEKVADQHILSVQRDPGAPVVYVGFVILFLMLVAVFFFSHQRVWAAVETRPDNTSIVTIRGNTNRGANAFDEKFRRFIRELEVGSI